MSSKPAMQSDIAMRRAFVQVKAIRRACPRIMYKQGITTDNPRKPYPNSPNA